MTVAHPERWRGSRIGRRLTWVVTLCAALILLSSLGVYHRLADRLLADKIQENVHNLAVASLLPLESDLRAIASAAETLARAIQSERLTDADLIPLLTQTLEDLADVFALAIALEPNPATQTLDRNAPFVYRRDGQILMDPDTEPQPLDWYRTPPDWYRQPRALERPVWTEPYEEDYGGQRQPVVTLSIPLILGRDSGQPRFGGVLAADISIDWLTREMADIRVLDTGFGVLISRTGTILSHPNPDLVMRTNLLELADSSPDPGAREAARRIGGGAGGSGLIANSALFGTVADIYYVPVPLTDWTLAIVFPMDELYAEADRLTLIAAAIGVAGLGLLLIAIALTAHSIVSPLRALADATRRIAAGDFETPMPPSRRPDEVGDLTTAFGAMTAALRRHLRELADAATARERIESELGIAHEIQMSLVPDPVPAPLPPAILGLASLLLPAREVGGDFYDFFRVDDHRLCFVMADVSGKGVPAALFMARAKTLIKATARTLSESSPAEILTLVNAELASDNKPGMFVTVFCGILDVLTGELSFANAGHNPPVLLPRDAPPRLAKTRPQPLLGILPELSYRLDRLRLTPGDRLFLYTDGVTEAMNAADELYTDQRLLERLTDPPDPRPEQTIQWVLTGIRSFAGATPQSDDIAMLMLDYRADAQSA